VVVSRFQNTQPERFQPTSSFRVWTASHPAHFGGGRQRGRSQHLHDLLDLDGFEVTTVYGGVAAVTQELSA
jgi:hypothetical protein